MTKAEKNKLLGLNAALWIVALLAHPLSRIVPTGSGDSPKIFELIIPVLFLMLAGISTWLLSAGIGAAKDD